MIGGRMMDRRRLLSAAALAAAPSRSFAAARRPLIINALGGLENPNLALARPPGAETGSLTPDLDARTLADAHASGLTAVNITLGYVFGPEDPYEYSIRTIGAWDRLIPRASARPDQGRHAPPIFERARDRGPDRRLLRLPERGAGRRRASSGSTPSPILACGSSN